MTDNSAPTYAEALERFAGAIQAHRQMLPARESGTNETTDRLLQHAIEFLAASAAHHHLTISALGLLASIAKPSSTGVQRTALDQLTRAAKRECSYLAPERGRSWME